MLAAYLEKNDEYRKLEVRYEEIRSSMVYMNVIWVLIGLVVIAFGILDGCSNVTVLNAAFPCLMFNNSTDTTHCDENILVFFFTFAKYFVETGFIIIAGVVITLGKPKFPLYADHQKECERIRSEFNRLTLNIARQFDLPDPEPIGV